LSNILKRKAPDLPNLHALRGIAALMVVIFHFDAIVMSLNFSHGSSIIHKGYLMVDLFFMLSGFIILHVYGEFFSKQLTWKYYFSFLKARLARIYPLHVFTLMILIFIFYASINSYMLGDMSDSIHDPAAIPSHLLLLQSFGTQTIFTWNITSWSISAEWFAYLLFPVFAILLGRYKNYTNVFIGILAIIIYLAIFYYLPRKAFTGNIVDIKDINVSYDWGFLRGLAGFMTGMIAYRVYQNTKLISLLSKDVFGILIIIMLLIALSMNINDLIYLPLFMMLLLSLVSNTQLLHSICKLKAFQFIGKISYSIYMIHYILILCVLLPALDLMRFNYTGPGSLNPPINVGISLCGIFLLVVVLFSSLSYDFIERPFRNWINKKR